MWIALGSPLAAYDHDLLTVHMIQHLLLMTFAPALIWLGEPLLVFSHGIAAICAVLGPSATPLARRFGRALSHAGVLLDRFCVDAHWMARAGTVYIGDAFRSVARLRAGFVFGSWVSFLVASYSTLAERLNCAAMVDPFILFSRHPAVRHPLRISCILPIVSCIPSTFPCRGTFGFSVLEDQQCAAALMWTCVTLVYLVPAAILSIRLLSPRSFSSGDLAQSEFRRRRSIA